MPFENALKLKLKFIEVTMALFVEINLEAKWWIKTLLMLGERKRELRDLMGLDISIHHSQQAWKGNDLV